MCWRSGRRFCGVRGIERGSGLVLGCRCGGRLGSAGLVPMPRRLCDISPVCCVLFGLGVGAVVRVRVRVTWRWRTEDDCYCDAKGEG